MSEKGQKIFKVIVWISITLGIVFAIFNTYNKMMYPAITQEEWKAMLAEGFGDEKLNHLDEDAEYATGEYAALTCMRALGDSKVNYISEEDDLSDEELVDLAVELGVVSKRELKRELTEEEANSIIVRALGVYFDPEYYPEYCEIETVQDIIDADEWEIVSFDEKENQMLVKLEEAPEVGTIISYTDEFGIMKVRTISSASVEDNDVCNLQLENIEDISRVLKSISFSGTSDFSYLTQNGSAVEDLNDSKRTTAPAQSAFYSKYPLLVASRMPLVQLAEWEWFEDKTAIKKGEGQDTKVSDIELTVKIEESEENGKISQTVTTSIEVTSAGKVDGYEFTIDESGEASLTKTIKVEGKDGIELEFGDVSSVTESREDSLGVEAKIEIEDFSVCTSGYFQWSDFDDKKNYVEVLASAKSVNISSSVKIKAEEKFRVASFPIPIAATAGTVSIDLNIYLVISAEGELSLWYEIDNPRVGVNVSVANGLRPLHGHSNEDAGVKAKIEVSGGCIFQAAVMVLKECNLADPGVDARIYASASTVEVTSEYELKEAYIETNCVELSAQGPIVSIKATTGDESLLYDILDFLKVSATYNINEVGGKNVPWKVVYHTEANLDGTVTCTKLEGNKEHEDICTHIQLKKPEVEELIEVSNPLDEMEKRKNQIAEENARKRREAQEKIRREIERAIEKAIEKYIIENCEDCEDC